MMMKCYDFEHEKSELKAMGEMLGVQVLITPKYHAEIAGEGIEYSWGVVKSMYHKIHLSKKKGKKQFIDNVMHCLSSDQGLSIQNVRRFSKRAWPYLQTYYLLRQSGTEEDSSTPIPLKKIDSVAKSFKTH